MKATMMISFLLILSTISLTTYHTVEGTCTSCGSVALIGPLNDDGHPPSDTTMVVLQPHCTDTVNVTCRLELRDDQSGISNYNPRLRLYLTADGKVCKFRSGNGSDAGLGEGCEGISYIYYEHKEAQSLTFTYLIPKITRIDNSVVTWGVHYHPGGDQSPSDCFGELAALISLDDSTACSPTTTSTTSTPSDLDNSTTLPLPADNNSASTSDQPTTSTDEPPMTNDTEMTTNTKTPELTNPAINSSPRVDNETCIGLVESETFIFIVTPLAAGVILLLLLNVIQCRVIVSRMRRARCREMEGMDTVTVFKRHDITEQKC